MSRGRRFRAWVLVAGAVLLGGCAGHTWKSPAAPSLACPAQAIEADPAGACAEALSRLPAIAAAEAARMAAGEGWSLQGRVAISAGAQSGSARIEWQQPRFDRYEVTLSAPVTRQSWRLAVDDGHATLLGLEGGERSGPDASALLREATGWDIPVASLRYWLRGLPAEGEVTTYWFGVGQQLVGLEQGGWRIDFTREGAALPTRITATRGESRVRLVIDQWGDATSE